MNDLKEEYTQLKRKLIKKLELTEDREKRNEYPHSQLYLSKE